MCVQTQELCMRLAHGGTKVRLGNERARGKEVRGICMVNVGSTECGGRLGRERIGRGSIRAEVAFVRPNGGTDG